MNDIIYELLVALRQHPRSANISDLKIVVGDVPWINMDGAYHPVGEVAGLPHVGTISVEDVIHFCDEHGLTEGLKRLNDERTQMFDASVEDDIVGSLRVHGGNESGGKDLFIRLLHTRIPTIEELGLPPIIKKLPTLRKGGLLMFTGATGDGKSTSLAALIDYCNAIYHWNIITLEDPIEYRFRNRKATISQMELGAHFPSFEAVLAGIVRANPTVVLVGEMRNIETMRAVIQLANTGHLVLSTQHDRGAAHSVRRVMSLFSDKDSKMYAQAFADSLIAIVSQRLIPAASGEGRVAACEIMIANNALSALMREEKFTQITNSIAGSRDDGMQTLEQHLSDLVDRGLITYEHAKLYANEPDSVKPRRAAA
jgi:twitching motility protein PilT